MPRPSFLSFVLLLRLPPLPTETRAEDKVSFIASTLEGASYAFRHNASRGIVLTVFASIAFISLDNVALPFLTRRQLGSGAAGFGLVTAAAGIGMVIAAIIDDLAGIRLASFVVPVRHRLQCQWPP